MGKTSFTIGEALAWGERELAGSLVPDPGPEAEYLLSSALHFKRHELFMNSRRTLSEEEEKRFREFIGRRKRREPSQYITGFTEWRGLVFKVTRDVLIPRPETELLVDEAVAILRRLGKERPVVVDLCTGSGCIAVSVAKEIPGAQVYGTDISERALLVSAQNAAANGVMDRITFLEGDLFSPLEGLGLEGKVDIILSNPPYVSGEEMKGLEPEVRDYEPESALYGGPDGLDFIRRIIRGSPGYLAGGAFLIMEIGFSQGGRVLEEARGSGLYEDVAVKKDLSGIARVLVAKKSGGNPP